MSSVSVKKNRLLLVLVAGITVTAVFFALNEAFGWLSYFRKGQGQEFEAGYIEAGFTEIYAVYGGKTQADTKAGYRYSPGDDLCEGPREGDREFERMGFNLNFWYEVQSQCVVRFKVDYTYKDSFSGQDVTVPAFEAYGEEGGGHTYFNYTGAALTARNKSMILASFDGAAFTANYESDPKKPGEYTTYWYYGAKSGGNIADTVLEAPGKDEPVRDYIKDGDSDPLPILKRMELAGDNIFLSTGKITIRITAQIRQFEAGVIGWGDYKDAHFDL